MSSSSAAAVDSLDDVREHLASLRARYTDAVIQSDDNQALDLLVRHHRVVHETAALNRVALRAASRSEMIGTVVEAVTYYVNLLTLFFPLLDPTLAAGFCFASGSGPVKYQCSLFYIALVFLASHLFVFPAAHLLAFRGRGRTPLQLIIAALEHSPLRIITLVVRAVVPNSRTVTAIHKDESEYLFLLFWNLQFVAISVVAMASDSSYDAVSNLWAILATSIMETLSNLQRYAEHARPKIPAKTSLVRPSGIWAVARRRELVVMLVLALYLTIITAVITGPLFFYTLPLPALLLLAINAGNVCTLSALRKYPDASDTSGDASLDDDAASTVSTVTASTKSGGRKSVISQLPTESIIAYGFWDRLAFRLGILRATKRLPYLAKPFVVIPVAFICFISMFGMLVVSRAVVDEISRERAIRTAKRAYSKVRAQLANKGLDIVSGSEEDALKRRQMIEASLTEKDSMYNWV